MSAVAQRICSVEDCDGVTGVPGTARGWCSKHYNRWIRTGDPCLTKSAAKWGPIKAAGCAVEGCPEPYRSSGYCTGHYSNVLRHGEATPRKRGEIRNGCRICPRCERDLPIEDYPLVNGIPRGGPCRQCELLRSAEWRAENVELSKKTSLTWQKRHPDRARDRASRRRARKVGAVVGEKFTSEQVFLRDSWICQLCNEPISPSFSWPDLLSPSMDHRIALANGGAHSFENCQASHLGCNIRKGARSV